MPTYDKPSKQLSVILEKYEIDYHHHDEFESPPYTQCSDADLQQAVIVVYSEASGPWKLAINVDGSVSLPNMKLLSRFDDMIKKIKEFSCEF